MSVLSDKREETAIARKYMGKFAVGTMVWAAFVFISYGCVINAALQGQLSLGVAFGLNLVLAIMAYMVHHEANHGNIAGYHKNLRWIEPILGNMSMAMLTTHGTAYFRWHLAHHGHTNDPERDPDHMMVGSFWAMVGKLIAGDILVILAPLLLIPGVSSWVHRQPVAQKSLEPIKGSVMKILRGVGISVVLLAGAWYAGYFAEALLLWYLPGKLALWFLNLTLVWLPHHPHDEQGRYTNTRVLHYPGSWIFMQGHDHHLMHHMFPRVPFYHLGKLFRELQPQLESRGVIIEKGLIAAFSGKPQKLVRDSSTAEA